MVAKPFIYQTAILAEVMVGERLNFSKNEEEPALEGIQNLERILQHLLKYAKEHEIDLELEDLTDILGEDDNDLLGNLATIAAMYDIDYTDFLVELGVPLEGPVIDEPHYLEITDGNE